MAIRRDYENQGPSKDFLPALLTAEEFKGTPVEHAFTHIGNALSNGGMDPDTFANTIKEAKRMMGGGIPRDQLEDLKKMVGENVKKFVDGARNNALLNMPPHLIEAKEYLAGQVKDMDVRSQAFSNKNLGLSIDEISAEQQRNASGMMAMFIDQLTADLTNEDAGEVFDSVKQTLDSSSTGDGQTKPASFNSGDVENYDVFQKPTEPQDASTAPTTTQMPDMNSQKLGGADVDMRKLEGPMSGIFSDASSGEHDLPELTQDLTPDELQEALRQARELIDMPPERQIAKFQDPNPLMWVGVAIAGILFPEMRPSLFALPFQVGLAERDRQQALFDRAYQDADQKWKTKLDVLTKRADVIQRERDRATSQAITLRGQDLQDAREWAKIQVDADQTTQKRMDGLWDKIDDYLEKGGTREAVLQTIKEINSMSDGEHLFINPEQAQAILGDSQRRYDLTTKGKELLNQGRELTNAGKLWTNNFNERTEELKVAGLEVGLDLKTIQRDMNQFKLLNAPKDLALKWAQIIQNINQSQANIQNMISDNKRADANLELSKMRTQLTGLSELAGILKDRKATMESQMTGLNRQMEAAILSGDSAKQAEIQGQMNDLKGQIEEADIALGKEGSDEGLYGYIKQVGGQVSDIQDKFGGIDRPNTPSIPGGDVKVPHGYGESRSITAPKDDGKYALDNGGTFDLGQTYKYGAKGADGKTDCSGFVCTTMSSIGSPELKNFPAGSIAQTSFIEGKIQNGDVHWGRAQEQWEKDYKGWGEGVEKYNTWLAKYNAAPAGQKPFLMNEMPKEPGEPPSLNKTLKNGDLVYFIVPKTKPEDSGRHVGIYIGTDKDGKALIAEAYSARVPDAEQVRIASYDLDALLPRSDEEIKAASKKMFMGAYRFYPKGKQ